MAQSVKCLLCQHGDNLDATLRNHSKQANKQTTTESRHGDTRLKS